MAGTLVLDRIPEADVFCGPQFVVRTAPHPRFERRSADLHLNATISLVDALVGFTTEVRAQAQSAIPRNHTVSFRALQSPN